MRSRSNLTTSPASDVEAYIAQAPADRRAAIEQLRNLCRRNLAGYKECIEYGMRNGAVEVAFASQKQYIAVYMLNKSVLDEFRGELAASSIGRGCLRFKKPEQIDFKVLGKLLRATARSKRRPC